MDDTRKRHENTASGRPSVLVDVATGFASCLIGHEKAAIVEGVTRLTSLTLTDDTIAIVHAALTHENRSLLQCLFMLLSICTA